MHDIHPPDYSTAVGKVRALIPDKEMVDWSNSGTSAYMFDDNHIEGLLGLYGSGPYDIWDVRRAAADAVDAIATSEALISKVIKTEDLQTDGAKLANALIVRAQQLRRLADKEELDYDASVGFTVVDFQAERQPGIIWPGEVRTSWFDQVWGGA